MAFSKLRIPLLGVLVLLAGVLFRGASDESRARAGATRSADTGERAMDHFAVAGSRAEALREGCPDRERGVALAAPADTGGGEFAACDSHPDSESDQPVEAHEQEATPAPEISRPPVAPLPPPPGPLGTTTVWLLQLRCTKESVTVERQVRKDVIFRSSAKEGSLRYSLLDHGGKTLYQGSFEGPALCYECPAGAPDHESGCVRIPHAAELFVKVPDIAGARWIAFSRETESGPSDLGTALFQ